MSDGSSLIQGDGALTAAAARVADARADLSQLGSRLAAQIQGMGAGWTGAGADSFGRLLLAWQERHARITDALSGFEAALHDTERSSVAADQAQADAMARVESRLSAG